MAVVEVGAEETPGEEDEEEVEETPGVAGEGAGEGETLGVEEGAAGEAAVAGALAEHKRMLAFATFRASTSEQLSWCAFCRVNIIWCWFPLRFFFCVLFLSSFFGMP